MSVFGGNLEVIYLNVVIKVNDEIKDLMITKYAILPENYIEGNGVEENIIKNGVITNIKTYGAGGFDKFTIRIFFQWFEGENELLDDIADTNIGVTASQENTTFKINANIQFEQYFGETIEEEVIPSDLGFQQNEIQEEIDNLNVIEVKNSQGIITQAMILIDSQAYVKDNIIESIKGTYDNVHLNQVEWYESEIQRMNAENEKISKQAVPVKSMAFFHIPLVEMLDSWNEFKENGYKDTKDFKFIEGIMGEGGKVVYCGLGEDDLFEKMVELDSTKAMFNGHDHLNSTTFEYKGIQFSYGYSVDYFAYSGIDKLGSQRGCTMITCKPDTTFTIDKYNFYSDRYNIEGFAREGVTMQYEDVTYQVSAE